MTRDDIERLVSVYDVILDALEGECASRCMDDAADASATAEAVSRRVMQWLSSAQMLDADHRELWELRAERETYRASKLVADRLAKRVAELSKSRS